MAHFITSISGSLAKGFLFTQATRYVNPELLSAGVFAFALFGSDLLGPGTTGAVANGIIVEFLMLHANVGIAVAAMAGSSVQRRRRLVMYVGGFYFLFVIGVTIGMGAWWMLVCFLLLLWSRMQEPATNAQKPLSREIVISMIRFFIYMLMGGICAGILTGLGADDELKMLTWGMCYFLVLFLLRNKIARLRESDYFK